MRYQFHRKDDPEYLELLLERLHSDEDVSAFLLALHDIAREKGGISALSAKTGINRQNLYRSFSREGNPKVKSLASILKGLGYRLSIKKNSNDNDY